VVYAAAIWSCWLLVAGFAPADGCGGCGGRPGNSPGSLSLAWSLTDLDGTPTTCEKTNARSVAMRVRSRATGDVVNKVFPCLSGTAIPGLSGTATAPAPAGSYDLAFALLAADETRLATAPDQTNVVVADGRVQTLMPLTFAAATGGRLVVSLTAPPTTSNCKPQSSSGAGITGVTIIIEHVEGRCAPVTFLRARGATQLGTVLANDCAGPSVTSCIETEETLTVPSMDPGSYLIRVVGKIGPLECWRTEETVVVPAAGKSVSRTLHLTRQNVPGC
jgi:hypothetical protein